MFVYTILHSLDSRNSLKWFNDLSDVFQSAYRPAHSSETAFVRIQDDILHSLDSRKVILVLLDLRAAFDTVDYRLLVDKLHDTLAYVATHTAGYSRSFRSERKLTMYAVC